MALTEEEKRFKNPDSYWEYDGEYLVELTEDFSKEQGIPQPASIACDMLRVSNGRIKQSMGGIQFYALPNLQKPFRLMYKEIFCIREADGTLLWKNRDST